MSATQTQEERLELNQLLQNPKFVTPVNTLLNGFMQGSIGAIVSAGILYQDGTDDTDPKFGPRRYENFRISNSVPSFPGICNISIDPLQGEKGFIASVRLESQDIPHSHAGLKEGFFNWIKNINYTDNTAGVFELFDVRGIIAEVAGSEEPLLREEIIESARRSGYTVNFDSKEDGFVFTVSERFYLATDFVNKNDVRRPYINMLEIVYTVKMNVLQPTEEDGEEALPVQNWVVLGQAKFFSEFKDPVFHDLRVLIPSLRTAAVEGKFSEFVKNIQTVSVSDAVSMYLLGRESNPKLLIRIGLDNKVMLSDSFELTKDFITHCLDNLTYQRIKEEFKGCLEQFKDYTLTMRENYMELSDKFTTIKMVHKSDEVSEEGIYITFKEVK